MSCVEGVEMTQNEFLKRVGISFLIALGILYLLIHFDIIFTGEIII